MGEPLSQIKHCSFPCISGQLLSLLYQDVCPIIRPITFDFLFELQSRQEKSSGENCYSNSHRKVRVMGWGKGILLPQHLYLCGYGDGGQEPWENLAPRNLAAEVERFIGLESTANQGWRVLALESWNPDSTSTSCVWPWGTMFNISQSWLPKQENRILAVPASYDCALGGLISSHRS